jgi:hypothetical protein
MIEIKSNFQKNKEYDELDRFFKLPFSIPQCHQNNKNAHKRKADTNATFTEFSDFRLMGIFIVLMTLRDGKR